MPSKKFESNRFFLKDTIRKQINFSQTSQSLGLPAPPVQKPCAKNVPKFDLPDGAKALMRLARTPVGETIASRESVREYKTKPTDSGGDFRAVVGHPGHPENPVGQSTLRTVPSAGARHALETYLVVNRVNTLSVGLYRYLPFDGQLAQLRLDAQIGRKAAKACFGQDFIAAAAVTFFWTAIPARMEWRYDMAAHKVIAIDVGHVCQNLYLIGQTIGAAFALLPLMIRKHVMSFWVWTVKRNSPFTWPRLGKDGIKNFRLIQIND